MATADSGRQGVGAAGAFAAYAAAVPFSRTYPPTSGFEEPILSAHLPGIERLRANLEGTVPPPPSWFLFGWRLSEVAAGCVVFEFEPLPAHASYGGTVHGGVLAALADSAMGCATLSLLDPGQGCVTQQLSTYFSRPASAPGPILTARGEVRSRTRATAVVEAVLTQDGKEILRGLSSYAIRDKSLPGQPEAS